MRDDVADQMADRLIDTFPTGTKRSVWFDVLVELNDPAAAEVAVRHVQRTRTWNPLPAHLLDAYDAERRRREMERDSFAAPKVCEVCDDTGWQDTSQVRTAPDGTTTYLHSASKPCVCTIGRAMVDVHQRMIDQNRRKP